ncbi:MAG: RtcB family protein [Desulfobacter sp.]|nr:MAG: RtcB family protein [Desulfobacter sp.]
MGHPKKYAVFGDDLDPAALEQMDNAMSLPVTVKGALMPDAHKGYGLPIGGVLATDNAVIPYAVGVDIACRVKMSVLPISFNEFEGLRGALKKALENETRFGYGQFFKRPKNHPVMDEDWQFCSTVAGLKNKAWKQLGTSGAGNHFAEFGRLALSSPALGLDAGDYIALITHSGSRGTGAAIARHYSTLARSRCPKLPKALKHLAWLTMGSQEGEEYFRAMTLMGKYSAANHEIIHGAIFAAFGESPVATVENHHNFAFKEKIGMQKVIVHRKGAVPAARGVMGIIPGSMADPAYIIKGKGNEDAINSAAHGAGRAMSRTAAFKRFTRKDLQKILTKARVTLISAGLDEIPMAYKNIDQVMSRQKGLVETLATFEPRLVKMAPAKPRKYR